MRADLTTLADVPLFAAGWTQDGSYQPPWLVRKLAENFARLSAGRRPYYAVPLAVGHGPGQRELRAVLEATGLGSAGRLASVRVSEEPDGMAGGLRAVLRGDFEGVPAALKALIDRGTYNAFSVEYCSDFRDHTGRGHGPAILRACLVGAAPPRVRGMGYLSRFAAVGRNRRGEVLTFSDLSQGAAMDRRAVIEELAKCGFNTGLLSDSIPDDVLAEMLRLCQSGQQAAMQAAAQASAANGNGNGQQQMADDPADPEDDPSRQQISQVFALVQSQDRTIKSLTAQVTGLVGEITRLNAERRADREAADRDACRAFCEQLGREGKLTPAELGVADGKPFARPGVLETLLAMDNTRKVHRFSDTGPALTARELHMEMLRSRQPARGFSEQLREPLGAAGKGGPMTPERRKELLGKTQLGKSILLNGAAAKD